MQHISGPLLQAYIDGFCNEERIGEDDIGRKHVIHRHAINDRV